MNFPEWKHYNAFNEGVGKVLINPVLVKLLDSKAKRPTKNHLSISTLSI